MKRILTTTLSIVAFLAFSVAVSAQDDSAAALYNDGVEKYKAKDYAGALELFEQALSVADPAVETDAKVIGLAKRNGSVAIYRLATEKRKEKAYDEAISMFDKGIEWAPESYSNYLGRAQALDGKGEKMDAVVAYLKAAEIAEAGDKAEKAEQYVAKAERIVIKTVSSKKWDDVLAMGEAFGERESADLHNALSRAYAAKGNGLESLKHAQKAMGLATTDKDKHQYYLAKAFEANGEKAKAAAAYAEVTEGKYYENAQYKAKELSGSR